MNQLFIEVRRGKSHIFLDANQKTTVLDLKKMISEIMQIDTAIIELWKCNSQAEKSSLLHDSCSMVAAGYTPSNAKPHAPAIIGLRIVGKDFEYEATEVSSPNIIPDPDNDEDN